MRKYKDDLGVEIKEGNVIRWYIEDGEDEVSAGVGNASYYTSTTDLTAKKLGDKLIFVNNEGSVWSWSDIKDNCSYINSITIIK